MIALRSRLLGGLATLGCVGLLAAATQVPADAADPQLNVSVVRSGLAHPWSLAFTPDGSMLYTQRDAETVTLRRPSGTESVVLREPVRMWHGSETGLMGIEVDRGFAANRTFYTCHGYESGSTREVRVAAWQIDAEGTSARFVRNLVTGLPSTSGRHGGCALLQGAGDTLLIGTGDSATGSIPQSLRSGGGKVLRVSTETGAGVEGNPFIGSGNAMTRRIYSYGHRNVQGLARSAGNRVWSVEQGSYRDDEANRLEPGANFGWNPVPRRSGDPAYNEGADSPMTDYSLSGAQLGARWSSGTSTIAASGATFLRGAQWGSFDGALVVAALKNEQLRVVRFDRTGQQISQTSLLTGQYGRLRAAELGPDGALYVTTSEGSNDKILRIVPKA